MINLKVSKSRLLRSLYLGCQAMLGENSVHFPAPKLKKDWLRRRPFLPRLYLPFLDENEMGDNQGFFFGNLAQEACILFQNDRHYQT